MCTRSIIVGLIVLEAVLTSGGATAFDEISTVLSNPSRYANHEATVVGSVTAVQPSLAIDFSPRLPNLLVGFGFTLEDPSGKIEIIVRQPCHLNPGCDAYRTVFTEPEIEEHLYQKKNIMIGQFMKAQGTLMRYGTDGPDELYFLVASTIRVYELGALSIRAMLSQMPSYDAQQVQVSGAITSLRLLTEDESKKFFSRGPGVTFMLDDGTGSIEVLYMDPCGQPFMCDQKSHFEEYGRVVERILYKATAKHAVAVRGITFMTAAEGNIRRLILEASSID
ncbi:MAG: hypothetical protein A4E19_07465 [Nitrospira sp. SG-bin1]|nr:MAG: hypothetical protein A4E19_07465 [Nitrospira sp. SG-bin1]